MHCSYCPRLGCSQTSSGRLRLLQGNQVTRPAGGPKAASPTPGSGDHPCSHVLQAVGDHTALGTAPSASPRAEEVDGRRAGCAKPAAGSGDCLRPAQGATGGPWTSGPLGNTAGLALMGTQHPGTAMTTCPWPGAGQLHGLWATAGRGSRAASRT